MKFCGGIVFAPVCLFVCEQLPDHSFSCGVMKLAVVTLRSGSDSTLKGQGQDRAKGQIHLKKR